MSAKDLIARWENALAEAQLAASPGGEISDEELEAAATSVIAARSGLRAGQEGSEECQSLLLIDCFTISGLGC
jgi:hypothetical protein